MTKDRRLGRFCLDWEQIDNKDIPEVFYKMKFVPLRVECLSYNTFNEYIGTSCLFEDVPFNTVIPVYDLIVNGLGDDITVSATKTG